MFVGLRRHIYLLSHTKDLTFYRREPVTHCVKILDDHQAKACGSHLVFQNESKNILRQVFVIMKLSSKSEMSNYNTFARER